ncbi:MAG TPA: hypothetical protein VIP07_00265 [Candidatus Limnocylindria bacterium]
MSGRALRAFGPWLVSLVAVAIGIGLIIATPPERIPAGFRTEDVLSYMLLPLSATTVGAVVAWRRPNNAVGWLLAAIGWISCWQAFVGGYAIHGLFGEMRLPLADVSAWAFSLSGIWVGVLAGNLLARFPDGRITQRRAWVAANLFIAATVFATVAIGLRQGPLFFLRAAVNPFGLAGADGVLDTAFGTAIVIYSVAMLLALSALLRRWNRALGVERQQFKWFLLGMTVALGVVVVGIPLFVLDVEAAKFVVSNGVAAVPIALGVAILRYRLYDIDLFIKRTVVYGGTSLAIALTFFLGILALQALLRPLTAGSELAIAAATLASLALLQPIRRRVQNVVDRRFDRARFNAARTIDAFADQLRDEVDLDALRTDLLGAVQQTMAPAHSSLWLRPR